MPMPAGYLVLKGRCPTSRKQCDFLVNQADLDRLQEEGPRQKFYDTYLIGQTLRRPEVIFKGLKRPGFHSGYCYARVPKARLVVAEPRPIRVPPPEGMVFLVFVQPRKGYVVFDWEFRLEDDATPGHPENWERNFERRIWLRP